MKARLDLSDVTINLGNNGVVVYVGENGGDHVGKLRIGQATVEWCPGRKRIGNGTKISMKEFVELLNAM